MVRRSTARSYLEERAFPVRVAFVASQLQGSWYTNTEIWLRENLGPGEYAHHGKTNHTPYAMAFYFRSVEVTQRFVNAFPHFELADTTDNVEPLRQARRAGLAGSCRIMRADDQASLPGCRGI